jgi:hypothetical protein
MNQTAMAELDAKDARIAELEAAVRKVASFDSNGCACCWRAAGLPHTEDCPLHMIRV